MTIEFRYVFELFPVSVFLVRNRIIVNNNQLIKPQTEHLEKPDNVWFNKNVSC